MDFIYFFWPLLLVIIVAGVLFRNRAHASKPTVTRSRAWRDQSAANDPFPNTVLATQNDMSTYASIATASNQSNDSTSLSTCSDVNSNAGVTSGACSDTSSTSTP